MDKSGPLNRNNVLSTGTVDCRTCPDRDCALFADLEKSDFDLIQPSPKKMFFAAGSVLYNAGDPGQYLFTIREGSVKLTQYLPDGAQRIVRLLKPFAVAGLETLLDHDYEQTATTLQPTLVCCLSIDMVHRIDERSPHLHHQLMVRWHDALREADEWLVELSTGTARNRVARLLLSLKTTHPGECDLFNREDIGAILGITTETASRVIAAFKRQGIITEIGAERCFCKLDALHKEAQEDPKPAIIGRLERISSSGAK